MLNTGKGKGEREFPTTRLQNPDHLSLGAAKLLKTLLSPVINPLERRLKYEWLRSRICNSNRKYVLQSECFLVQLLGDREGCGPPKSVVFSLEHLKEKVQTEMRSRIGGKLALPAGGLLWWSEGCSPKWDVSRVSVFLSASWDFRGLRVSKP